MFQICRYSGWPELRWPQVWEVEGRWESSVKSSFSCTKCIYYLHLLHNLYLLQVFQAPTVAVLPASLEETGSASLVLATPFLLDAASNLHNYSICFSSGCSIRRGLVLACMLCGVPVKGTT